MDKNTGVGGRGGGNGPCVPPTPPPPPGTAPGMKSLSLIPHSVDLAYSCIKLDVTANVIGCSLF